MRAMPAYWTVQTWVQPVHVGMLPLLNALTMVSRASRFAVSVTDVVVTDAAPSTPSPLPSDVNVGFAT